MSSSQTDLRLDWCSHLASKHAVEHWHYSRSLPTPPHNRVGVWEAGKFIGTVIFSRGASGNLGKPYGCSITEVCELTRIALAPTHEVPVSRVVKIAILFLRRQSPGLRLIVSFADPNQRHHGGIYQAGGWIYSGKTTDSTKYRDGAGKLWHGRQVSSTGYTRQYGTTRRTPRIADLEKIAEEGKHRYLMPLDDEIRARILPLAQPYPKRAKQATAADPVVGGGAAPTRTLQIEAAP